METQEQPLLGQGLDRLCAPRAIAIIGASDRPGSFGRRTQENLARFTGDLYLVNPGRDEIGDVPCYRSVADLPVVPDCAIIATPRSTVEALVDECAAAGVGGVLIYASGFAEVGTEDLTALQSRISARARAAGMRLIGPNAIGLVNFGLNAGLSFMDGLHLDVGYDMAPTQRTIGVVSQSGALGLALTQGMMLGHGFSHAIACGNSCDVDVADCIAWLVQDPGCKVIALTFEGHEDPARVEQSARLARKAGKPLVVFKMGEGAIGAEAAAAHTGSVAGDPAAWRALFERAGAIVVPEYEALLETAAFFAKATPNEGEGAAIVATSGGAAIMAADAAQRHGVPLPQPRPDLRARLEALIPEFGSAANPADVTAQVLNDMQSLIDCAGGFLEAEEYGVFVIPHIFALEASLRRIMVVDELAGQYRKVICTVWIGAWTEGPGARELVAAANTVMFRSMDRCFGAIAAWRRWLAFDPG